MMSGLLSTWWGLLAFRWRPWALLALMLIVLAKGPFFSPMESVRAAAGQTAEVFYMRSTDGGATFGDFQNISGDASRSDEFPDVAVSGDNVYIAWEAPPVSGAEQDIYIKRSVNGGTTFAGLRNVSNNPTRSTEPDLDACGTTVHLVWKNPSNPNNQATENDIFYSRSTDSGLNWGAAANITNTAGASAKPVVGCSGNTVIVLDHEDGGADVWMARSTNNGASFATLFNLSNDSDRSKVAELAFEGNNVHAVWENPLDQLGTGIPDILYRRSTDGGATWTPNPATNPPMNLSNTAGVTSKSGAVAVSGSTVHVVWVETFGSNDEIVYIRSTDGGATWSSPVNISNTAAKSAKPAIAVAGNRVFVAWEDDQTGAGDIYYRFSADGGLTWQPNPSNTPPQNLSNNPGRSSEPSLAVDPSTGVVHIVWFDFSLSPGVQIPTAVTLGDDVFIFGRGSGDIGELWYRRLSGGTWGPWTSLGGGLNAPPAAVAAGSDLYVFVRGNDNSLYYRRLSGGNWGDWGALGGGIVGVPGAVATGPNDVYVFVRGIGQDVWYRHWNGSAWEDWTSLGGVLTAGPVAAAAGTDIFVFGRGGDNALWYRRLSGGTWSGWQPLEGNITSTPAVASAGANALYVFVRGDAGDGWYRRWNGSTFEAWQSLGGSLKLGPTAGVAGGDVYVAAIGESDDLWYRRLSGGTWSAWTGLGGGINAAPSPTGSAINNAFIFVRGSMFDDVWYRRWNGSGWESWTSLGGNLTAGPS